MKINSFRWLAAAIVLTASGTVSTASPVPVVVDYENVVNSDTTVTAVGISITMLSRINYFRVEFCLAAGTTTD